MLTLGRLIVLGIGLVVVVALAQWLLVDLSDWVPLALGVLPTQPRVVTGSPIQSAFVLALLIASIVGLAFLAGLRGERESWIGAALVGVGPVFGAGLGLTAAVQSTLAGSFSPENWLGATVLWGAATVVCVAVAIGLRRLPTPTSATAGPEGRIAGVGGRTLRS